VVDHKVYGVWEMKGGICIMLTVGAWLRGRVCPKPEIGRQDTDRSQRTYTFSAHLQRQSLDRRDRQPEKH
jgi:hypothetical protein